MTEQEIREIFQRKSNEVLAEYPKRLVEVMVEVYEKGTELGIELGRRLERDSVTMNPVSAVPLPEDKTPVLVSFVRHGQRDFAFLRGEKSDKYISEGTANGCYPDYAGVGDIDYWMPLPAVKEE